LRNGENEVRLGLESQLDRTQGTGSSNADGRAHPRKEHQIPQREHWKRHTFRHSVITLEEKEASFGTGRCNASTVPLVKHKVVLVRSERVRPFGHYAVICAARIAHKAVSLADRR
jgi:hypothetical protein